MKIRDRFNTIRLENKTHNPIIYMVSVILILLCAYIVTAAVSDDDKLVSKSITHIDKADKLFEQENWAEAREEYDQVRQTESDWHSSRSRLAVEQAVACSIKLQQWDDAIQRAEMFIQETKGSFEEAIGRRFLGGLYLTIPHYGTKRGASFLRGQWTQGVQVSCWRKDRREAIKQYEQARQILIELTQSFGNEKNPDIQKPRDLIIAERIGVDFDLVSALANRDTNRYDRWGWLSWWWDSVFEGEEDSEAMEEADYEEPRWAYYQDQTPPSGIPLDSNGEPIFIIAPDEYNSDLGDGAKIRFLLEEIQTLDTTEIKENAAKALMRWAMMTRSLYGPETAEQWISNQVQYDNSGQPVIRDNDSDRPDRNIWELQDDEALTVAGGRLRIVKLPPSENVVALLESIGEKYPKSSYVEEAYYSRALYFQTRKQFPRAIAEYENLIKRFPEHKRSADAKSQIATMQLPKVHLDSSGVYLPDGKPELTFNYRNTDNISFKAYSFDMVKYIRDSMEEEKEDYWTYRNIQWSLFNNSKRPWKDYLGEETAAWSDTLTKQEENRAAKASTLAPLSKPGAYIVEASTKGNPDLSRTLVLVTDIAIVQKNIVDKGLIYIADARTGQPLADKAVRIYEHWTTYKDSKSQYHWDSTIRITNADGVIEYTRNQKESSPQVEAIVTGDDNRMAFSFFQNWSERDPRRYNEDGPRSYIITDRPVYRSGDTVKFNIWYRNLRDREFDSVHAGQLINIKIYDSRNNEVEKLTIKTDSSGCASGEFKLGEEPPLGVYHIQVNGYSPDARRVAGGLFRVEEYKLPEFEVTVKPSTTQGKLGDKIKANIQAKYYFGAPVSHGDVTYKIYRENYNHVYYSRGEYDWLYGKGYGHYYYAYPWLGWWDYWGRYVCGYYGWPYWYPERGWQFSWGYYGDGNYRRYQSGTRNALRELVSQGKAKLKEDGTLEIEIDTADAKAAMPDRDHRYTIEAEVRDASRRTIEGQGSVIVTRREFYAFIETNGGWYSPGNEVFVHIRTLTADDVPVVAKGDVVVYRIEYNSTNTDKAFETEVKRWEAQTDVEGRLEFKYPIPDQGQYRIVFETQDSQGQQVLGNAIFWVAGAQFSGKVYRFNDLEVIADKRTYKVGDIAHLLINTAESNSRILFSDNVSDGILLGYRFIDIPGRSKVIDIPITEKHVPNFFIEATLVRNGSVHMENRQLFVPPVEGLLNVIIKTDKEAYKPGQTGLVEVEMSDYLGKPVSGNVTITAYDRAVTYIQDEFGPSPQVFFYGQKRNHTPYVHSSMSYTFNPNGSFNSPENMTYQGGEPEGWRGYWTIGTNSLTLSGARSSSNRFEGEDLDLEYSPRYDGYDRKSKDYLGDLTVNASKSVSIAADSMSMGARGGGMGMVSSLEEAQSQSSSASNGENVQPEIRTDFSDTALWLANLTTDNQGKAQAEITFPQSLTTWKVRGYALTNSTQVGDAETEAITTKNLIVRLQAPRFFMERDEVVLSANVHNYLETSKQVTTELILPKELFEYMDSIAGELEVDQDGNYHLYAKANVKAQGEHRFDWLVMVKKEGLAKITVKAMTDEESDGMRMAFPVLVHGINKTISQSGSYQVEQEGERQLKINLPDEIDPEQTRLEVTLSPSLGGVMIDALPYLVGYPYGCIEQTMSRFYPTVLVAETLKNMGLDLETIGAQRKQMNQGDLDNRFGKNNSPVFDSKEIDQMVKAGLNRIYSFQQSDGGWGWWRDDQSSPYQTAYVLQGLHAARQAGVNVDSGVYSRGMNFLQNFVNSELEKPTDEQRIGAIQTQAYIAYILSLENYLKQDKANQWLEALYNSRSELNNYGRCLLAMAMHNLEKKDRAELLLRNVLQFVEKDDSNETAWVRTPEHNWWFWWNNDIETNAWTLRAMMSIDPDNDLAPRLVKWLLNNRRSGYYWRSTRDTALVIAAMTKYMIVSGEAEPDYNLTVNIDGRPVKPIEINKENLFTFDNRFVLYGLQVKPGPHTITLSKQGKGALYYSCYLSYFTKEEDIKGAGNEIFVKREYYKLIPQTEEVYLPDPAVEATQSGLQEKPLSITGRTELRSGYKRVPLVSGDSVKSGDKIEVVLKITAKNTYDYLAFEDMKPAGCEPVEVRSGSRWAGGVCSHIEFRDEKVVFFVGLLEQGEHVLRYKLRAEIPGVFHALPTTGFAMYAPEIRAISDEMRLGISDINVDGTDKLFQQMAGLVKIGMTGTEVTKAIGKSDLHEQVQYDDIRQVWKYNLAPDIRFQVNFNSDGRVVGHQLDAPKQIVD